MENELKIQITGELNTSKTTSEINSAIQNMEKHIGSLKLNVHIDDKATKVLSDYSKAMENHKKINQDLNKVIKEEKTITKEAQGVIKEKITQHLKSGEIIQKEIERINKKTNATKNETTEIRRQISEVEKLGEIQKKVSRQNADGQKTGGSDTYKNGSTSSTYNYDKDGNVTSSKVTQNLEQQRLTTEQLINAQTRLRAEFSKLNSEGAVTTSSLSRLNSAVNNTKNITEVERLEKVLKRAGDTSKANNSLDAYKKQASLNVQNLSRTNGDSVDSTGIKEYLASVNALSARTPNLNKQMSDLSFKFKQISADAKDVSHQSAIAGQSLGNMLQQAAVKFPLWLGISTVVYGAIGSVKALVDTLYVLDERLVSIQKVIDNANMEDVFDNATAAAYKFGQTIDASLESLGEISKLGFNQKDAEALNNNAMLLSTVGEFKNNTEAASALVAIMRQYKLSVEETTAVVDSLNSVSNQTGADTVGLTEGLSKSSSTAAMAGVSFHELSGMISNTIEVLKIGGNEAGTFYKALFSRYMRDDTQKMLEGLGIQTKDLNGEMRAATDVLADLGAQYDTYSSQQKNSIAQALGGVYHINKVSSLLENQENVLKNTGFSIDSYGSATKELETFQDGLRFKTNEMITSFQELAMAIGDSGARDAIVKFLETVTFMTKGFTELTESTDGWNLKLPLLAAGVYGAVKAFNALKIAATGAKLSLGWIGIGLIGVELLASAFMSTADAADLNTEAISTNAQKMSDQTSELERLISKYDELKPQAEGNAEKQDELHSTLEQIQALAPHLIESTGQYGDALDLNKEKADQYISSLKQMTDEQLTQATTANAIELSAVNVDIDNTKKDLSEVESAVKSTFDKIQTYQSKYNVKGILDAEEDFNSRIKKLAADIGAETQKGNAARAQQLSSQLEATKREYEDYISFMKDSGGDLQKYSDNFNKLQELEGKKDGIEDRQKAIDAQSSSLKGNSEANEENANTIDAVNSQSGDATGAIDEYGNSIDGAATATDDATTAYEKYADELANSISMQNQTASASEMLAGITSSQIDQIYEQVAVYQLLSRQENLNEQQKLMLADATNFLAGIYPYLVQGSEANIDAILRETKANDILLEAVNMSAQGQLSSQENQTLNSALGAKSRIEVIKAEIIAVDKMVQAYKQAAIDTYNAAVAIGNDIGTLEAEKSYKRADALGDSRISNLNSELETLIPKFEKYTGTLGKAIDYQGRASEAQAKSAKATDKSKKSTDKAIDAVEDYVFIESKLNKELEKNNILLEKNANQLSKYARNSREYRKSLEKDIKLLKERNKIIDKGIKSIDAQIKAGKYITPGVVSKDEAVSDTYYNSSSSSSSSSSKKATGKYSTQINSAAKKYKVDPLLVKAVAIQESQLGKYSKNVMQVTSDKSAKQTGTTAEKSIKAGAKYLSEMLDKAGGNLKKALAAYNMGEGILKYFDTHGGYSVKNMKAFSAMMKKKLGSNVYGDPEYVDKILKNYPSSTKKTTKSSGATRSSVSNTKGKVTSSDVASYYMDGFYITDGFNARGGTHKGLDLNKKGTTGNGDTGTLIKNIASGTVETIFKNNPTAGNAVIVRGDDGKLYQYNHLHKAPTLSKGQRIAAGDKIGLLGNTGDSSGAHLDLKIKDSKGNYIDPEKYLKKLAKDSSGTIELTGSSGSTSRKTIKKGSTGSDVKALQKALGLSADGIFGKATEKAVKAYQKKNGIKADGVVGAETWNKINKKTSEANKKNAENKQNKADAKSEKAELQQEKNKNNQEIQDLFVAIGESWAQATNKEVNIQLKADSKRQKAEENGFTSQKGRAYLKEENKELKKLEKEQKARLKELQKYYQKNKDSMSQATRAEWNKLVPELQADILATQQAQQESLLDFFQATSDAYDKEADALQKKADAKRAKAEKLDPTSQKYRDYLKEEGQLLDDVEKKQKNKIKSLKAYYKKNKADMDKSTRESINALVDEAEAGLKEIQDAQNAVAYEIVNSSIDGFDKSIGKKDNKITDKQLDAELIDDKLSKDYRNNLRSQIALEKEKKTELKSQIKYIEKQINSNKNLTAVQKEELRTVLAEKNIALKELTVTVEELNNALSQNNLDAYLDRFSKVDARLARQLRDIDDKIALADEENQKELIRLNQKRADKLLEQRKAALEHIADLKRMRKELKGNAEALKQNSEEIQAYTDEVKDLNLALDDQKDLLKQMYNDIADEYINAMKQAYEAEQQVKLKQIEKIRKAEETAYNAKKKELEDEGKKLDELYDKRLREIDDKEDADSYDKDLAERQKEAQDIKKKINKLSMDDSTWAKKERAALQEELTAKQEEIDELIHNRNLDLRKQSLSDEKDALDKSISDREEAEDEAWDKRSEALDEQEEEINKYYENLLNDERYWSKVRQDILNGDIQQYKDKLTEMGKFIEANSEDIGTSISNNIIDTLNGANEALSAITMGFDELAQSIKAASDAQDAAAAKAEAVRLAKEAAEKKAKEEKAAADKKAAEEKAAAEKKQQDLADKLQGGMSSLLPPGTIVPTFPTPDFSNVTKKATTTSNLNLRKTAGTGDNVLLTIPKGKKVDYLGVSGGWAKVKYDGKTGYVSKSYLEFKSGGYTGNGEGFAMLHEKEQVLNKDDTKNLFNTVDILNKSKILDSVKLINENVKTPDFGKMVNSPPTSTSNETIINMPIHIDKIEGNEAGANQVFKILNKKMAGMGLRN